MNWSQSFSDGKNTGVKMMHPCKNGKLHIAKRFLTIAALAIFLCLSLVLISCKAMQKEFASPDDAVQALIKALKDGNDKELLAIFGPESGELLSSGDEVADRLNRQRFVEAFDTRNRIEADGNRFLLIIGKNNWPFPIPVMKKGDHWIFDAASGKEEILNRRIGRNELNIIQVMLALVDAQREYAMVDRDGDSLLEYAQVFLSDPEKKNGLYWPTMAGEEPSPIGELLANAQAEGYETVGAQESPRPYHGYFFRILTAQAQNGSGGAYDYIVNGKMIGGFAVIAFPAEYHNSGIMTFIVNHEGVVYQKDLGENTDALAKAMTLYNPDESWTTVQKKFKTRP